MAKKVDVVELKSNSPYRGSLVVYFCAEPSIRISNDGGDDVYIYEDEIVALRAALAHLYYCGQCHSWFQTDGHEPVICPTCGADYDATE